MHVHKYCFRIILVLGLGVLLFVSPNTYSQPLKVLYLGNSHTFWNDLPQMIADLALSKGDTIIYESNTPGGCTWGHPSNGHLFNSQSLALINAMDWNYVVLQEHSLFAVIDYYRDTYMCPAGDDLDSLIKLNNPCTETVVRDIWAKKMGGQHCINTYCSITFNDFEHMQDSLTAEYLRVADTISCTVSPVGEAWKLSIINGDPIELFYKDQSHPSLAGSYLAACVYYAVLFQKPSEGSVYTGGLSLKDALYFQQIADSVVLSDPEKWRINGNQAIAGFEFTQLDNTVLFIDNSINADSFLWDFGDGTTDTTQNPVYTYSEIGTYIVKQQVSSACYLDSIKDTIVVDIINYVKRNERSQNITIVPGNVRGSYKISSINYAIENIRVYNLYGKLVFQKELSGKHECEIRLNNLSSGLYILAINTNDIFKSYKINIR